MKALVALLAYVAVCAGSTIPLVPRDNSHYIEGVSRYVWMPDGEGDLRLVDLQGTINEQHFNGPRNGADNQYWLFTRNNRNNRQILTNGNINSVRNSNYRADRPTAVLVHGLFGSGTASMNPQITSALLDRGDFNVIVVDWNRVANGDYFVAVNQVPGIGQHLGNFIQWLFNNAGGNFNQLHLIGYSLGAHVVGNAGRALGGRPSRVTGLDPAGPLWGGNSNALNKNAGVYVESIHTGGPTVGIYNAISDADFFPNGGNQQPGCGLNISCSHGRSVQFFDSSVRTDHFIGRQCSNLNQARANACTGSQLRMGNSVVSKRGSGLYGLTTATVGHSNASDCDN